MMEKLNDLNVNGDTTTNNDFRTHLRNDREINWIELLCDMGSINEFIGILDTSKSEILAIMKYRRLLRQQGKSDVSFIELNTAYVNKQHDKLHKLLEKMFIESISKPQFKFILSKIDNKDNGLQRLYDRHMEDKDLRVMTVALIL